MPIEYNWAGHLVSHEMRALPKYLYLDGSAGPVKRSGLFSMPGVNSGWSQCGHSHIVTELNEAGSVGHIGTRASGDDSLSRTRSYGVRRGTGLRERLRRPDINLLHVYNGEGRAVALGWRLYIVPFSLAENGEVKGSAGTSRIGVPKS